MHTLLRLSVKLIPRYLVPAEYVTGCSSKEGSPFSHLLCGLLLLKQKLNPPPNWGVTIFTFVCSGLLLLQFISKIPIAPPTLKEKSTNPHGSTKFTGLFPAY